MPQVLYHEHVKKILGDEPVLDRKEAFIHVLGYGTHSIDSLFGHSTPYKDMYGVSDDLKKRLEENKNRTAGLGRGTRVGGARRRRERPV
jgi:hypothetical protein